MFYSPGIARSISTTARSVLKPASMDNITVLNFWQPGYTVKKIIKTKENKEVEAKVFVPTSTPEAALSFLLKQYGANEYLKFKDNIHPGHCAIQTKGNGAGQYLSIGTNDEFNEIGVCTHHELNYSADFEEDVLAFRRFPEKRFSFFTLDANRINKMIDFFKEESRIYSMLGDRFFGLTEGESCATISHRCLKDGGIDELLSPFRSMTSSQTILTPSLLATYADIARSQEFATNNLTLLLNEFEAQSQKSKEDLEKLIEKSNEIGTLININEENRPKNSKRKP
jgi:hypothetical protein